MEWCSFPPLFVFNYGQVQTYRKTENGTVNFCTSSFNKLPTHGCLGFPSQGCFFKQDWVGMWGGFCWGGRLPLRQCWDVGVFITCPVHIQTLGFIGLMNWTRLLSSHKRPKHKLEFRMCSFTVSRSSVQMDPVHGHPSLLPSPHGKPNCHQEVGLEPMAI